MDYITKKVADKLSGMYKTEKENTKNSGMILIHLLNMGVYQMISLEIE